MLRILDLTATLALTDAPSHNLYWRSSFELSLDCFICERVGRTTILTAGDERAVCSGDRARSGRHFTAARVAGFDPSTSADGTTLHVVVNRWWAPFHDEKRKQDGTPVVRGGWARFTLAYTCPGDRQHGSTEIQSNTVRPTEVTCKHCGTTLARNEEQIRVTERP